MRVVGTLALGIFLASAASAQSQRELLGKLVRGDDQSKVPVAGAKVVLDEAGSHGISNDDGLFHVFLPDAYRPGDEVTVTVTFPGYAVYEPAGGKLTIPADLVHTRKEIQLLPKGSPKFLSDVQLRAFVERAAKESNRQPSQPDSKDSPDLGRYLKDWAVEYGFSVQDVQRELNRWAADVASRKSSQYDLSLAAFAVRNFRESRERALDAAAEEEASLGSLEKQHREGVDRLIRDYRLAGHAAFSDSDFKNALGAFDKALSYSSRDQSPAQWADLQLGIGRSEVELSSRSEGADIASHAESGMRAYRHALEVYTRELFPQNWARAQLNLGALYNELGERGEGPGASADLVQSVKAYNAALGVFTRQQFPEDWAATQNNLCVTLRDLGERAEGVIGNLKFPRFDV
jgi:tetratricopeptide (TPR) repeat protein